MTNYQETLNKFIKHVVSQAKRNLTSTGQNASKKLYNSISGEAKQFPNSIGIYFDMEEYGFFQDRGVKGINSGSSLSKFSFKSKGGKQGLKGMPPPKAFDKWNIRRGFAPRGKGGKFKSRQGINFAMARHVFEKGIKPSLFFTKPFEAAFKKFPDEMIESYGFDVVDLFDSIMKQNFKK
jgi:hypothetical protein